MVEEKEVVVGGVFMFWIGLDPFVLVCTHSRDMCSAWWHLKQSPCFMHVSVSFFERHSVCGPNIFHCIWVMVGGWSVPQFILWESESLLLRVSVVKTH